ncbi:hypothetical protein [Treponema sp.]|uniref:hypothetical protein n=1 Tax=Treponema sp. TaxID=166 RepID=UPI0025E76020|nr:hypothetical protein [Treponema sp.]MCR5217386.1 hypothetical protein [Treponema sp.]
MNLKKIISATFIFLSAATTAVFAQNGYFTGNGGSDKKVLIYDSTLLNGKSDKSDQWIPIKIKSDIINDLNSYSNIQVIDAEQTETIRKIQRQYESSEYSSENPVELGKSLQAKYYITLSTTRNKETYSLSATIFNIETRKSEGGFTSSFYSQTDYLTKVHGEACVKLLSDLGVNLTTAGKRLIQIGSLTETNSASEKEMEENLSAITAELERITKEESKLSAGKLTDLELEAEKTRIETQKAVLERQQAAEKEKLQRLQEDAKREQEEELARMDRDTKQQQEILKLSNEIEEKAMEIRNKKIEGLTAGEYIELIEAEKQTLYANEKSVNEAIASYNNSLKEEYDKKIEERKNRPLQAAEKDSNGNRSELSQAALNSDIAKLQGEYEEKAVENATELNKSIMDVQNQLRKKISADIEKMESKEFTSSSLTDSSLYFRVDNYDGNAGGWYYTMAFAFSGKTVYTDKALLTYKEVTGKEIPEAPKAGDKNIEKKNKLIQEYFDIVDSYDSFFRLNVPYIEAIITYKISAENYTRPSAYRIKITNLVLKNVSNSKKIKTVNFLEVVNYNYTPACKVDWRTKSEQEADIKKEAKAKFEKEKKASKNAERKKKESASSKNKSASNSTPSSQDARDTVSTFYSSGFAIPGNLSLYMNQEEIYFTIGYSFTIGLTENFFLGANLDFGFGGDKKAMKDTGEYYSGSSYYSSSSSSSSTEDLETFYDFTGIAGASFNLASCLRFSLWGECGTICGDIGLGSGASLELYTPNSGGAYISATALVTEEKYLGKFSIGYELCF